MLLDTTPDVEALQVQIWRRLGGEERLRLGFELSLLSRKLAEAGLRHGHAKPSAQKSSWRRENVIFRELDRRDRGIAIIPTDTFQQITQSLTKVGIPYMLTGCCASNYHGAPRSTVDIGFVIVANAAEIESFLRLLPANEYRFDLPIAIKTAQGQSTFHVIHDSSGWRLDLVFLGPTDFDKQRLQRRQPVTIEGISLFVESPEDLLLSQLQWTKAGQSWRQVEDAAGILKVQGNNLDFGYIENWVNQLELTSQWAAALKHGFLP